MNMYITFSTLRSSLAYKFFKLRTRAMNDAFQAKLTGSKSTLEVFPGTGQRISPSRKLVNTTNISVADIVGTFERSADFDRRFRPLKKHSLDRWVNAYMLHEQNSWSPILVHKVDGKYFVEDGHHRVSVARSIGMDFIEAKVWEYTTAQSKSANACEPATSCTEKRPSKAYAAG
ncbi:MAG: ParB-like nuclease domain-containing protein [Anaerolineales bacterium]|nr:ParB-like nuclease domain-containing protein [Anaerolineales bacterium]